MITHNGKIDDNDLAHVLNAGHDVVSCEPAPNHKGRPHFNLSRFLRSDGLYVNVFHVKPVYYVHRNGQKRPLSEVTQHHGNKEIVLNDKWTDIHPQYLAWLSKRQRLFKKELSLPTKWQMLVHETAHNVFTGHIGLTTTTAYPDADPETTTVDGQVGRQGTNETWATMRDGAGTHAYPSGSGSACYIEAGTTTDRFNGLYRSIFLFDTSGIPDAETITSATIELYYVTKNNGSWNTTYSIYTSTPASNTDLVAADYAQIGTTTQSDAMTYANFDAGYEVWTLNATGIGNISKTGISKFGMRESTYDVANSAPTWGSGVFERILWNSSESVGGTSQDPKIVVISSTASGPANLKSYNTNLKANIKSINTNLIANVKSLNTNV